MTWLSTLERLKKWPHIWMLGLKKHLKMLPVLHELLEILLELRVCHKWQRMLGLVEKACTGHSAPKEIQVSGLYSK